MRRPGLDELSELFVVTLRYRRVRCGQWLEPAFRQLSPEEQRVALYCQTGPPTNGLGLFRLIPEAAAVDLMASATTFRRRLEAVCRALGWRFDPAALVLWIPVWPAENAPQSPNVVKAWRSAFDEVPACALKDEAASAIQDFLQAKGKAFAEAFGEVSRDSFGIREQEKERELEQKQEPSGDVTAFPVNAARAVLADFAGRWEGLYQTPYAHGAKDLKRAEQLVAAVPAGQLTAVVRNFFAPTDDRYTADARHPLALLLKQWRRYVEIPDRNDESTRGRQIPSAEATDRYLAELRGKKHA